MSRKVTRAKAYGRDLIGRGGRQFILPWGPSQTLSTLQAAERLGVCNDTVRRLCEEGLLEYWPVTHAKGSPWRVSTQSVEDYIAGKIQRYSREQTSRQK